METTDYDIQNINFANKYFDFWLKSEGSFKEYLLRSEPLMFCFMEIFKTMVKMGELSYNDVPDAIDEAMKWENTDDSFRIARIAKCILILGVIAQKRLRVTHGE